MLTLSEIKIGKKIVLDGEPFVVMFSQHSKIGRAGAVLRTKLRNLETGAIISKTFQGAEKFEQAEMATQKAQYLYAQGESYLFMNNETFEQFELSAKVLAEKTSYLIEGTQIDILYFKGKPINIELPIKIAFKVIEAPPAVKGNTADGGSKQVTIETGIKVSVPLFIKTGDSIRINTETGQYAERVS